VNQTKPTFRRISTGGGADTGFFILVY